MSSIYFATITKIVVRSIVAMGVMGTELTYTTITSVTTTSVVIGVPQLSAIPVVLRSGLFSII